MSPTGCAPRMAVAIRCASWSRVGRTRLRWANQSTCTGSSTRPATPSGSARDSRHGPEAELHEAVARHPRAPVPGRREDRVQMPGKQGVEPGATDRDVGELVGADLLGPNSHCAPPARGCDALGRAGGGRAARRRSAPGWSARRPAPSRRRPGSARRRPAAELGEQIQQSQQSVVPPAAVVIAEEEVDPAGRVIERREKGEPVRHDAPRSAAPSSVPRPDPARPAARGSRAAGEALRRAPAASAGPARACAPRRAARGVALAPTARPRPGARTGPPAPAPSTPAGRAPCCIRTWLTDAAERSSSARRSGTERRTSTPATRAARSDRHASAGRNGPATILTRMPSPRSNAPAPTAARSSGSPTRPTDPAPGRPSGRCRRPAAGPRRRSPCSGRGPAAASADGTSPRAGRSADPSAPAPRRTTRSPAGSRARRARPVVPPDEDVPEAGHHERRRRVRQRGHQLACELLAPEGEQLDHDDARPVPAVCAEDRLPAKLECALDAPATVAADQRPVGVESDRRQPRPRRPGAAGSAGTRPPLSKTTRNRVARAGRARANASGAPGRASAGQWGSAGRLGLARRRRRRDALGGPRARWRSARSSPSGRSARAVRSAFASRLCAR